MMTIKPHKAMEGDCVELTWQDNDGNDRYIIIDGGPELSYSEGLKLAMVNILKDKKNTIDLLILSHYDRDHIGGFLELFKDDEVDYTRIKKVWFNSKKLIENKPLTSWEAKFERIQLSDSLDLNLGDSVELSKQLDKLGIRVNTRPITVESVNTISIDNLKVTIVSPFNENLQKLFDSEPDWSLSGTNSDDKTIEEYWEMKNVSDSKPIHGASLSFIFELMDKRFLYLSDSPVNIVLKRLKELGDSYANFDLVKLSHHGSRYNISKPFIEYVNCSRYLISTDAKKHKHPNMETMAKIAYSNKQKELRTEFIINYPVHEEYFIDEREQYDLHYKTSNEFTL